MDMFEENKSWKKCTIKMTIKKREVRSQESAMQKKRLSRFANQVRCWVLGTGFSWIYTGFSAFIRVLCWYYHHNQRVCDFLKRDHFTQCQSRVYVMTQKNCDLYELDVCLILCRFVLKSGNCSQYTHILL